jgi:hypothetical protein
LAISSNWIRGAADAVTMKTTRLFCSVLFLSTLDCIACGGGNFSADDSIPPTPDVTGNGSAAPDASVPPNCDVTATPAKDGCVINETLGVFVAPPSADASSASNEDGTRGHPFSNMQNAIDAAKAQQKRVYACIGNYQEQITLADGVSIFGDLDCNQNWIVVAAHASIEAPSSPAVRADQITTSTLVDSLDMIAPDATTAGASSIALIANGAPALTVANATIHAGKAMNGGDGIDGAQLSNGAAANGASNANALLENCSGFSSNPIACTVRHAGGLGGGINQCVGGSKSISGGVGGGGGNGIGNAVISASTTFVEFGNQFYQIPTVLATNGNPQAANASTAAGGTKGAVHATVAGANAQEGSSGAAGASGSNGSSATAPGVISADGFVPANGTVGTDGQPGQGGGGGAGYDYVTETTTTFPTGDSIYFTNGAGGGAGGCPGLAGTAGSGGGASIAVIAVASPMTFDTCSIQASDGGDGGKGTLGSASVPGGSGGADMDPGACAATECPVADYKVHAGGNGGAGGASGVSGSGAGGPSIGIAVNGGEIVLKSTTPTIGNLGHGVAAISGGGKTVPASADGTAALTVTF